MYYNILFIYIFSIYSLYFIYIFNLFFSSILLCFCHFSYFLHDSALFLWVLKLIFKLKFFTQYLYFILVQLYFN